VTEPLAPPAGWELAAKPQRRRRWVWVLVGTCAVIAILFGVGVGLFVTREKPVIDAANAFLDDVADGRFEAAYAGLCEADQDGITEAAFAQFAASLRNDLDAPEVNPFGVDLNGDRATVDFDPDGSGSGDVDENYELDLRKEDGDWKVCNLFSDLQ
jgi:hypothetical protein